MNVQVKNVRSQDWLDGFEDGEEMQYDNTFYCNEQRWLGVDGIGANNDYKTGWLLAKMERWRKAMNG